MLKMPDSSAVVAQQNDLFRQNLGPCLWQTSLLDGRAYCTVGVASLGDGAIKRILKAVREYDTFDPDNDPTRERDFGRIEIEGVPEPVYWKIDVYDTDERYGADDRSQPSACKRVLTVMLATEY